MGILDDAIREHLDLQRRRGADPAEVQRAEREALGPVRRTREAPGAVDLSEEDPAAGPAYDHAAQEGWSAEPEEDWRPEPQEDWTPDSSAEPPVASPRPARAPLALDDNLEPLDPQPPSNPAPAATDEPVFDDSAPHAPEPERPVRGRFGFRGRRAAHEDPPPDTEHPSADAEIPPPDASPAPLSGLGGGETVEYNVEDALAPHKDQQDAEDVLEETPEFLQDTPDHDRLWFEQRPPRDFDFDG
jgi:hypothetical protein